MFPISAAYDPGIFQTNPMKEWNAAPSFTALSKTYSPAGNFAMVVHILPNSRHSPEMEFYVPLPERLLQYLSCPICFCIQPLDFLLLCCYVLNTEHLPGVAAIKFFVLVSFSFLYSGLIGKSKWYNKDVFQGIC